jgi:tetratricopeptide (TPR) repeat protein
MPLRRSSRRLQRTRGRAAFGVATGACLLLASCAGSAERTLPELVVREARTPSLRVRSAPPPPGVDAALLAPVGADDPLASLPFDLVIADLAARAGEELAAQAPPVQQISEQQRGRALRFYTAGRSRRLAGDAPGAIEDLRAAIEADPGAAPPYRELGEAHRARGDRLAAVAAFREALLRDPDDVLSLIEVGLASADRGNNEVAAGLLSRVWLNLDDAADAALPFIAARDLGAALLELGYVRAGADALRIAADLPDEFTQPTSLGAALTDVYRHQHDIWVQIGDAEARLGDFDAALAAYERAGAYPTFNPGALLPRRVYAAMRLGRPAAAAAAVIGALAELEGRADTRHFRLIAYLREESEVGPALAREIDALAASLDPAQRRLVAPKLLRARSAAMPTDEAVALLRDRLAERPRDADAIEAIFERLQDADDARLIGETLTLIAAAPMQESRYSEALLSVRPRPAGLLEALPGVAGGAPPWARDLLAARLHLEAGDGDEAERIVRTLVQGERSGPAAATLLAETLIRVGRSGDATGALAMLEENGDLEAVEARARILRAMGRYAAALTALEPLVDTTAETPPRAGDLLLAGQLAQLVERYEEAEHFYRLAVEVDPALEDAHAGLIGLYAPSGPLADRGQFTESMRRLREIAPSSRTIRWLRAQDLVAGAQYAEAERELLSLAEEDATDAIATLLTTLWLRTGSAERAEAWLREKRERQPGNPVFVEQLGRVLAASGRPQEGADLLRAWLEERPSDVGVSRQLESILRDALGLAEEADRIALDRLLRAPVSLARSVELAAVLINRGDLDSAARTLREGLDLDDPVNDAQREALVQLAGAIGQAAIEGTGDSGARAVEPEAASALLERVATIVEPLPGPLHASRIGLLITLGSDGDRIVEALRRAQREQAQIGEQLAIWSARRLADAERAADALRVVEVGVDAAPEPSADLVGAWLQQAYNARNAASSERAIRAAHASGVVRQFAQGENNQPLSVDEAAAELSYIFALAIAATDDDPGARRMYDLALEFNPRHAMTNNNVGYAMADRGENLDEAHRMLMVAYEERPADGSIVDSLGWVRYRLGLLADEVDDEGVVTREGAVTLLRRATELTDSRNDPVVHDHLGDAYWQVGRKDEAQRQWAVAAALIESLDPREREFRSEIDTLEVTIERKLEAAQAGEAPPVAPVIGTNPETQAEATPPAGDG